MKKVLAIAVLTAIYHFPIYSQGIYRAQKDTLFKYIEPYASVQFWGVYTTGERAQLKDPGPLERVDDRLNFSFRRARLGFKGTPYKRLYYNLTLYYDNLGRDRFNGTRGGVNDGNIGIWNAFLSWKATRASDLATITIGYFRPQICRESITAFSAVNSFDKTISQTYARQHIVGRNSGRAMGINVGGLYNSKGWGINYNLGVFNSNTTSSDTKKLPETSGKNWSPLLVERIVISLGDPELTTYGLHYEKNYFNQRRGLSIGLNASQQAETDVYQRNVAWGVDFLLNYRNINLDGEWIILERTIDKTRARYRVGSIRGGYNLIISQKYFIEPTLTFSRFFGDEKGALRGNDRVLDAGVNWYLNKRNYKINLHYVVQGGAGANGYTDGLTYQKGDYLGLGLLLII